MNNKNSSMIDMKPKDAIKLDIATLDKPKRIAKKNCYPKMIYTDTYIGRVSNMEVKKEKLLTLPGVKIHTG